MFHQHLQALRSFDPASQNHQIEELVALLSFGSSTEQTYKALDLDTPLWLVDANGKLKREISNRNREFLELQLKEVQASQKSLQSREEKKKDLQEAEERLKAKLAKQS